MPGLLRLDSPLYRAWTSAADIVIVNALTLAGCLPVLTAGAALTACARVTMDMARNEDCYIVRTWWRVFRGELRQSFAWWPPVLGAIALAAWESRAFVGLSRDDGVVGAAGLGAASGLLLAGGVILVGALVWLVPLVARFENTVPGHALNAVRLAVGCLGRTVACLAVVAAPAALAWWAPQARAATAWFMALLGPAFQGYLMALIQRGVIDRLRGASPGTATSPAAPPPACGSTGSGTTRPGPR